MNKNLICHTIPNDIESLIADLDGTLAESKSHITTEMSNILCKILKRNIKIGVISGGKYKQFEKQFLGNFSCNKENYANLYLLPTSGSKFYSWDPNTNSWSLDYALLLSDQEVEKITSALNEVVKTESFQIPTQSYGEKIENRGTQITLSALGQKAPIEEKSTWDPDMKKRESIKKFLLTKIPEFEIRLGGTTSIDITKKGIDKAYGINKFFEITGLDINKSLFLGDKIIPGGNDYAAIKTGIKSCQVKDHIECLQKLQEAFR